MFTSASSFNGDISKWDVSKVILMAGMFASASSFNGDISKWEVSRVTDMCDMFSRASSFTQTLCGAWYTSIALQDRMFDGSSGRICKTAISPKKRVRGWAPESISELRDVVDQCIKS